VWLSCRAVLNQRPRKEERIFDQQRSSPEVLQRQKAEEAEMSGASMCTRACDINFACAVIVVRVLRSNPRQFVYVCLPPLPPLCPLPSFYFLSLSNVTRNLQVSLLLPASLSFVEWPMYPKAGFGLDNDTEWSKRHSRMPWEGVGKRNFRRFAPP